MNLKVGDEITLFVLRLGLSGEGVAQHEGLICFVPGALPTETVRAKVETIKKSYATLELLEIVTPSLERVKPPCPVFGKCGGCQLQHLSYAGQLEMKRQRVIDALERVGKISCQMKPCVPSPTEWRYRNKIQMPYREGKLGLFALRTHELVEVGDCLIHCPLGQKALDAIRDFTFPHLSYLILKTAVKTQEVLVVLVATQPVPQEIAEKIFHALPEIKGVVENINASTSNTILGKRFTTLIGEGKIEEEILGLKFKVSPASFFQVNPAQAENLYRAAIDKMELTGKEKVLDAFCGVGTLSLLMAKQAKEVIGVEIVKEAIDDAKENARLNGLDNATFVAAAAERFIPTLKEIDAVLLNPPRKGCDPEVIDQLLKLCPNKIVYVSCDPATLARDLSLLQKGYSIESVEPFDMFPETAHVETLVCLSVA